jgi:hypothetical protein
VSSSVELKLTEQKMEARSSGVDSLRGQLRPRLESSPVKSGKEQQDT